jgi:hypothetical protein
MQLLLRKILRSNQTAFSIESRLRKQKIRGQRKSENRFKTWEIFKLKELKDNQKKIFPLFLKKGIDCFIEVDVKPNWK